MFWNMNLELFMNCIVWEIKDVGADKTLTIWDSFPPQMIAASFMPCVMWIPLVYK